MATGSGLRASMALAVLGGRSDRGFLADAVPLVMVSTLLVSLGLAYPRPGRRRGRVPASGVPAS